MIFREDAEDHPPVEFMRTPLRLRAVGGKGIHHLWLAAGFAVFFAGALADITGNQEKFRSWS